MAEFCKDKKLHGCGLFYTDTSGSILYMNKIPRLQKFQVSGYRVYRELASGEIIVCDSAETVKLENGDIVSVEMYDRKKMKKGYYRVNRHRMFVYTESGLKEGVSSAFFLKVVGIMMW